MGGHDLQAHLDKYGSEIFNIAKNCCSFNELSIDISPWNALP